MLSYKTKRYIYTKYLLPIKHELESSYHTFRMWELLFRMKNCRYDIEIKDFYDFSMYVGDKTSEYIFESMMDECYSDPRRYGYSLDRENLNWRFSNHKYFCNDQLLIEIEVSDGNWNGTEVETFEIILEG